MEGQKALGYKLWGAVEGAAAECGTLQTTGSVCRQHGEGQGWGTCRGSPGAGIGRRPSECAGTLVSAPRGLQKGSCWAETAGP